MTLQQLEYILAVDRTRHFARAAAQCHVTQPTLSMMIQKLEDELSIKIFDRTVHPVEPTEIGRKVLEKAKRVLFQANQLKESIENEKQGLSGVLNLAVIPTVAPYVLPSFFPAFTQHYPDVVLNVSEMMTGHVLERLQRGELDMALMATPLNEDALLEIPLYYEKFCAYIAPNEPFYQWESLSPSTMPEQDMWVLEEGHCLRNQVFNFCVHKALRKHHYEAGTIDTLVRIVDANGGYTILPELHKPFLNETQLLNVRPIVEPEAVREISLVIHQDFVRERMLNAVADTIKGIIPPHMLDARLKKFAIKL